MPVKFSCKADFFVSLNWYKTICFQFIEDTLSRFQEVVSSHDKDEVIICLECSCVHVLWSTFGYHKL